MNENNDMITLDNFIPQKFLFVNFYKQEACIVWNNETIVISEYPLLQNFSAVILKAPRKIKDIKCLKNKIYVLCSPSGVYKLLEDHSFARLSTSGISIGINFYEVFSTKNNILYCENKHLKTIKPIFNILGNPQNIKLLHLYFNEIHPDLQKTLIGQENYDTCLITNQNNLFLFVNEKIKIVYNCNTLIIDITVFYKNESIFGIILITDVKKIILIYPKEDKLNTEQVHLDSQAKALCAGICISNENEMWIIYSNEQNTYHLLKKLNNDKEVTTLSILDNVFLCFGLYKTNKLCGLTKNQSDSFSFIQLPIEELDLTIVPDKEINKIQLKSDMIEGTESIMDEIKDKVMELSKITDKLEKQRNLLKRINMYTIKSRVECIPKIKIYCLPDRKLVVANFQKNLPQGSQVVMSLYKDDGQIFVIKNVTDLETIVELSVPNEKISYPAILHVHSIVLNMQNGLWCLINDFIQDPVMRQDAEHPLDVEKLNFLNNKKLMLNKLLVDKNIDMKTLSNIKNSIRRELLEV